MLCAVSWSDLTLTAGALDAVSGSDAFWTRVGDLTPASLLALFVVAILTGRLVPKSTKDREVALVQAQANAGVVREGILTETNKELMAQIRVLLTGMEAVERRAKSPQ